MSVLILPALSLSGTKIGKITGTLTKTKVYFNVNVRSARSDASPSEASLKNVNGNFFLCQNLYLAALIR